jgi:hypothetical protein
MIQWMAYWLWWLGWRSALTGACMYTLQNVIHQEGYRIDWQTMFIGTLCAIVGLRFWMPSCKEKHADD